MVTWNPDHTITVPAPKKPKKITGTRFGAILGLNRWCTPFETWCAITRTYEEPFVDTKYTRAGKIIEPKQAGYMRDKFWWAKIISPVDVWGENYFRKTWGDFYQTTPIFGGMWDYLLTNEDGEIEAVFEMKTTKRVEDWEKDIPEYYAIQAALYAYLLNVDQVYMVCTILEDGDYDHPENFIPTEANTFIRSFTLPERYPNMGQIINEAKAWWQVHVETGVSPQYDEKRDADVLKALRANTISPDTDLSELCKEAEIIQRRLVAAREKTQKDEKRLKELKAAIKELSVGRFRDGDTQVIIPADGYEFVTTRSEVSTVDKGAMEADGVLEKYLRTDTQYKLSIKERT